MGKWHRFKWTWKYTCTHITTVDKKNKRPWIWKRVIKGSGEGLERKGREKWCYCNLKDKWKYEHVKREIVNLKMNTSKCIHPHTGGSGHGQDCGSSWPHRVWGQNTSQSFWECTPGEGGVSVNSSHLYLIGIQITSTFCLIPLFTVFKGSLLLYLLDCLN